MESDPKVRLEILKFEHRQEILDSFETFKTGEDPRLLITPAWRREAVLDRERRLRASSC